MNRVSTLRRSLSFLQSFTGILQFNSLFTIYFPSYTDVLATDMRGARDKNPRKQRSRNTSYMQSTSKDIRL